MGADFVDADELFAARHTTPAKFVAAHGWPAFRAAETELLKELIGTCPPPEARDGRPQVISLGGGVVEEEANRTLLRAFWQGEAGTFRRGSNAVVHVFREMDIVLSEGERAGTRSAPKWTNGLAPDVWKRRRPWFRDCCACGTWWRPLRQQLTLRQPRTSSSTCRCPSTRRRPSRRAPRAAASRRSSVTLCVRRGAQARRS
jgi:shikimate kinase